LIIESAKPYFHCCSIDAIFVPKYTTGHAGTLLSFQLRGLKTTIYLWAATMSSITQILVIEIYKRIAVALAGKQIA
jgi:hypothetical protein